LLAVSLTAFTLLLPRIKIHNSLFFGGILTAALTTALMASIINFDKAFTAFHYVFFNGNWMFPENSMLITLFPKQFFMIMAKRIIVNILIASVMFISAGIFLKRLQS